MTTRRARLQVKPNIGEPKGPAVGRPLSSVGITSDIVPDASKETDALPVFSNVDKIQEHQFSDKTEVLIKSADGLVRKSTALDVPVKVPDAEEESHIQVTNAVLPSRAQFRRFGKVNLSAVKATTPFGDHRSDVLSGSRLLQDNNVTVTESIKSDSLQNAVIFEDQTPEKAINPNHLHTSDKTSEANFGNSIEMPTNTEKPIETCIEMSAEASIEQSVETSIEKSVETDVDKHLEANIEIDNKGKMVPDIPSHAVRRSRFAKVKPNVVDTRRKQKESMKENVPKLSITDESKQTMPIPRKITVTPAEPDSIFTKCPNISQPPDTAEYMSQIQSSNLHVPESSIRPGISPLLISPVKTVGASHDKWNKVPSPSQPEPIIVRRARKHKIDAPTDQPPDKSIMKMRDLIHWNPSTNPMKLSDKLSTRIISGTAEKENIDKKTKAAQQQNNDQGTSDMDKNALPVAQVTIGPDGNIVINKKSLVVKGPDLKNGATQEHAIIDETDLVTTYSSFRRKNRSSRWSKRETLKFYKALAMIGTDFFLINKLFPKRNRFEIKKKFKREEKVNLVLMEKVLKERLKFDSDVFKTKDDEELSSLSDENDKITKQRKKVKEKGNCKDENKNNKSKRNKSQHAIIEKHNNYYEMDLPDSEPVTGDGPTCEPSHLSRDDGEVVDVLMDMSEGHHAAGDQESSDIYIATPVMKNGQARGKALPGSRSMANEMINKKQKTAGIHITDSSNDVNLCANRRPSKHVPRQIEHQSNTTDCFMQPQTSRSTIEILSNQLQYQVPACVNVPSMATDPSDTLLGNAVQNSQIQYSFMGNNYGMITPINLPIVNSHAASLLGLPANQGDGDQYVLVTVKPENGQETVIHIYRLHGGFQPTVVMADMDMTTIDHSDCAQVGNTDNVPTEGTKNTVNVNKIMNENDDYVYVENIENTHMETMDTSHTENVQNIQIVNMVNAHILNNIYNAQTESVHTEGVDQTESVATSQVDNTETESIRTSHKGSACYTAIKCVDNATIEDRESTILKETNPSLKEIVPSDVNVTDEPFEHASNT